VERLEHRDLLAGNVLVSVDAAGNLDVRGDSADNRFSIAQTAAGAFTFTDLDLVTPTTFNGAAGPVTFTGVTGSLRIDLKAGDDEVQIEEGTSIAGNLDIRMGGGSDAVVIQADFFGTAPIDVGGNLDVQTGQGDDTVLVDQFVSVTGSALIDTSDGADNVTISGLTTIAGNLAVRLGHQNDRLEAAIVDITGAVTVNASLGDDTVDLFDILAASATIDTSDGADTVLIRSASEVLGDLTIRLGLDNDVLEIGDGAAVAVGGSLSVNASRGDDRATLFDVAVAGGTAIDTSDGADNVTLTASIFAALTVNLGHDNDTLTVTGSSATSASLNGSAGNADTYDGSGGGGNTGALDPALVGAFLKGFEIVIL
jgi:hypothetical protein